MSHDVNSFAEKTLCMIYNVKPMSNDYARVLHKYDYHLVEQMHESGIETWEHEYNFVVHVFHTKKFVVENRNTGKFVKGDSISYLRFHLYNLYKELNP